MLKLPRPFESLLHASSTLCCAVISCACESCLLADVQVPVGLIFAQATHVVWPPWRWQRLEQEGHRRERRHDE